MAIFKGAGVALATPFKENMEVNYEKLEELVDFHVENGTDCIVVMGTTGEAATMTQLVKDVDNIVGVKDATGNISFTAKTMQVTNGDIDLYSGNDDQIVPIMALGGIGVISVLSNVAPKKTHDICQAMLDGDVKLGAKLQIEALPLIEALFCEVNPIPVKAALNLMGKKVGDMRMPLTNMEPEHVKILEKAMKDYGIL